MSTSSLPPRRHFFLSVCKFVSQIPSIYGLLDFDVNSQKSIVWRFYNWLLLQELKTWKSFIIIFSSVHLLHSWSGFDETLQKCLVPCVFVHNLSRVFAWLLGLYTFLFFIFCKLNSSNIYRRIWWNLTEMFGTQCCCSYCHDFPLEWLL